MPRWTSAWGSLGGTHLNCFTLEILYLDVYDLPLGKIFSSIRKQTNDRITTVKTDHRPCYEGLGNQGALEADWREWGTMFRDWRIGYPHTWRPAFFKIKNFRERIKIMLTIDHGDLDFPQWGIKSSLRC